MLSTYLRSESRRWAAEHRRQGYPASASPSQSELSSSLSEDEESDNESVFSRTGSRSRRSSVSSAASEPVAAVAFDQPRDLDGAPITTYASLDQAVARSTQALEAEGPPRRLVTPGKLYENEEDDDEIVEEDNDEQEQDNDEQEHVTAQQEQNDGIRTQHYYSGGLACAVGSSVAAAG